MYCYSAFKLQLIWSFLILLLTTCSSTSDGPSEYALDLFHQMRSLPQIAHGLTLPILQDAQLSIQTSSQVKSRSLINTLKGYRDRSLPDFKQKIQNVIDSVEYMGPGGNTKFFTFAFSRGNSVVEFVGIAVHKDKTSRLLDYSICSYTYGTRVKVRYEQLWKFDILGYKFWPNGLALKTSRPAIDANTRGHLEAAFLYELWRRRLAIVEDDKVTLMPQAVKDEL